MRVKTYTPSNSENAVEQREGYQKALEKSKHQELMGEKAEGQKQCFKCLTIKPLEDFYRHPEMRDGRLGKCKECTKSNVKQRYYDPDFRGKIASYEVDRFRNPARKEKLIEYQKTRRDKFPEKYKARNAVNNALRDGRLTKENCKHCGNPDTQAHHNDYSKPLEVIWCCFKCHREIEHGQKLTETILQNK